MKRQYNIDNSMGQEVIWYEEDGVRYSFIADPANSDYQAYLNKDKPVEHFTPIVIDEAKTK
jgi:hypothetical protein